MSKTLIVGDIHLGKGISIGKNGIGTALNSRIADQVKLLDWVIDQAVDNGVDCMILTGDIFEDVKPDPAVVNIFFKFISKLMTINIEVHIIAGNHDIKRTGIHYISVLDYIDSLDLHNVFAYKNINTIHREDISFTLLPFRDRKSLNVDTTAEAVQILQDKFPYELADVPTGNYKALIGHLAIEGSLFVGDEIDDSLNEIMCPLSMFSEFDYVWMGHVHRPQVRSRNPYIAHIGSLDISDFGETDHQKILVLVDTSLSDKFVEIPIPSRPLRKINVVVPMGFNPTEYTIDHIKTIHNAKSLENAIVNVEIKLHGPDSDNINRDEVEKLIYSLGAFYICRLSESKSVSTVLGLSSESIDNGIKPKTAVKLFSEQIKFVSEDDKFEFIALANSIIDKLDALTK